MVIFASIMHLWFRTLCFCLLVSSSDREFTDWRVLCLSNLQGDSKEQSALSQQLQAFIFFSAEYPICENYALQFKAVMDEFKNENVQFTDVLSSTFFINDNIRKSLLRPNLELSILCYPNLELEKFKGVNITVETFFSSKNGKIFCHGAIDDWTARIGQNQVGQYNYLHDAMMAHRTGRVISSETTKDVECFIE